MINKSAKWISYFVDKNFEFSYDNVKYKTEINSIPSCTQNCPAGINVKSYINLISNKKFDEALALVRENNPFPGVCGRVCTHPCEANCQLSDFNNPISIRALKRFIADYEVSRISIDDKKNPILFKEKIAIIGSGPAGLTTAADLNKLGYKVTVFETMSKPGGMLAWAIPSFRLPTNSVQREIQILQAKGIEIITNKTIADPKSLLAKDFDLVVLAFGTWEGYKLELKGENLEGVFDCLEFLKKVHKNSINSISGKVIVIGGGNSAFDSARTALRLGADNVTIAYRRTENEMPANIEEINDAKEEGIDILPLTIPVEISGDTKVDSITLLKAKLGDKDNSGRRRPVPIKGSEYKVKCDYVIAAIGASPKISTATNKQVNISKNGLVKVSEDFHSSSENIFAVGDVVRGPSTIVDVIGDAHICASSVHNFLRNDMKNTNNKANALPLLIISEATKKICGDRKAIPILNSKQRIGSFDEIEKVYSEYLATSEALRCNHCGPCTECRVCSPTCENKQLLGTFDNEDFLIKVPLTLATAVHTHKNSTLSIHIGHEILSLKSLTPLVDTNLCIACGRCEETCAYKAIRVNLKIHNKAYSLVEHDDCRSCGCCVLNCPTSAISFPIYQESRLHSCIENSLKNNNDIVVFNSIWATNNCISIVDETTLLMNPSSITIASLFDAFAAGARGVLIFKGTESQKQYFDNEHSIANTVNTTKMFLEHANINPERLNLSSSLDQQAELKSFINKLDKLNLKKFSKCYNTNIIGRIPRALSHLEVLGKQEKKNYTLPLYLHLKLLEEYNLFNSSRFLNAIQGLSKAVSLKIDRNNTEKKFLFPVVENYPFNETLLSAISNSTNILSLEPFPKNVAIHKSRSISDNDYYKTINNILQGLDGCNLIELESPSCDSISLDNLNAESRESAMSLLRNAENKNIDYIIPTSLDCLILLTAVSAPANWNFSKVKVLDIYSLLFDLYQGDISA